MLHEVQEGVQAGASMGGAGDVEEPTSVCANHSHGGKSGLD